MVLPPSMVLAAFGRDGQRALDKAMIVRTIEVRQAFPSLKSMFADFTESLKGEAGASP